MHVTSTGPATVKSRDGTTIAYWVTGHGPPKVLAQSHDVGCRDPTCRSIRRRCSGRLPPPSPAVVVVDSVVEVHDATTLAMTRNLRMKRRRNTPEPARSEWRRYKGKGLHMNVCDI